MKIQHFLFTMAICIPLSTRINWKSVQNLTTNQPFTLDFNFEFPFWVTSAHIHPWALFHLFPSRTDLIEMTIYLVDKDHNDIRNLGFSQFSAINKDFEKNVQFFLPSYVTFNSFHEQFKFKVSVVNIDSVWGMKYDSYSPSFSVRNSNETRMMSDDVFIGLGDVDLETKVAIFQRDTDLYAQILEGSVISTKKL
jgi:hypothetical protein